MGVLSIATAEFREKKPNIFAPVGEAAYTDSDRAYIYRYRKEGTPMKIVVLRTPAVLAPILRRMFGIRKEKKR